MTAPATATLSRRIYRWVRIALVLVTFCNLVVGIVGYFFLRSAEGQYTALLQESIPFLGRLQTATWQSGQALAAVSQLADSVEEGEMSRAVAVVESTRAENDRIFAELGGYSLIDKRLIGELNDVCRARAVWRAAVDDFLAEVRTGTHERALGIYARAVAPAYGKYIAALERFGGDCRAHFLGENDQIAQKSGLWGKVMFGLALLPVVMLSLCFVTFAVLLVAGLMRALGGPR